jgi:hypothetical protein
LGLSQDYKSDNATGKWLKYTFGLQYLPAEEVNDCLVLELSELAPPEYNDRLVLVLFINPGVNKNHNFE